MSLDYIGNWPEAGLCAPPEHGPPECVKEQWELCTAAYMPKQNAWFPFVSCLYVHQAELKCQDEVTCTDFTLFNEILFNVTNVCAKETGMSPSTFENIKWCAGGYEGMQLLKSSYARSLAHGFTFDVQWIFVDGVYFDKHCEDLTPPFCPYPDEWATDLLALICSKIPAPKPAGCSA